MSVQRASFYILLTLVTIAFAWLLIPYYTAVLWAVIMAVIFYPVQQWLVLLLRGRRNIAAFLSVLMCICLVIIPMLAIFGSLVDEGTSLYQRLSSREFGINGYIARIMAALPESLEEWLKRFELGTLPIGARAFHPLSCRKPAFRCASGELWPEHAAILHWLRYHALPSVLPLPRRCGCRQKDTKGHSAQR